MRDPDRIDRIVDLLREYWKQNPDLRLGQIVGNSTTVEHSSAYYLEDEYVEAYLRRGLDAA